MRWESVALQLARDAGIDVPDWNLHLIDHKAVLIVSRFDRAGAERVGYASAMTMLEARDRDQGSYLDIVEVIEDRGARVTDDVRQLWRRIAFSILISNTDDHLRNHGFLRASTAGWSLSPAFDLNPDPSPGQKHLSTAIDEATTEARINPLMEVADYFRLSPDEARVVLREVSEATNGWRMAAQGEGLDGDAVERMARAFEHEQADVARELVRSTA
jgi:serine/threonine-protein kinase HipA